MATDLIESAALPRTRCTFVVDEQSVHIPDWVRDLPSFRRWVHSDEVPEKLRICWLKGEVWIDMSKEQVFSHNQLKNDMTYVLTGIAKLEKLGRMFPDGMLLSNTIADFAAGPDAIFASTDCLRTGRVRLLPGKHEGFVEMEGTPDMVLEIVSQGSVEKDTEVLRELYWKAGIPEYWLVDAREERLLFDILRYTPKGYVAIRKQGGWLKSAVFGKSFKLVRGIDALGHPEFTLEVR